MEINFGRGTAYAALGMLVAGALAACGAAADSGAGTGATNAATSLGNCGKLPVKAPEDPSGVLAKMPPDVRAAYNGYDVPITASPWHNFKPKGSGPYDVAIVYSSTSVPYQKAMLDTVTKALEGSKLVGDVSVSLYETDPAAAVRNFQSALNSKPDIILAQPLASDPFVPLVKAAAAEGIPVITMQSSVNTPEAVNITPNAFLMGAAPTAEVAKMMGGKGMMLGVHGIPGPAIETQTFDGIKAALALCPGIKLDDSVVGQYNPTTAKTKVLKHLSAHPGPIDGVVDATIMGPGILSAFEQSGRTVPPLADPAATEGTLAYLKAHPDYRAAGSAQGAETTGAVIDDATLRMLSGEGPELNSIVLPTPLITRSNLGDYTFGSDMSSAASVEPPSATYPPSGFIDVIFGTH